MHRIAAVASALLVAGSLVACGQATDSPQPALSDSSGASSSPAGASPSAGAPSARPSLSVSPTGPAQPPSTVTDPKGSGQMTIRGQVTAGVEPGCIVLTAEDGKAYLLVGGDRALIAVGGRLEVVGAPQPGLMTTCQQGTPFQVTAVRRI